MSTAPVLKRLTQEEVEELREVFLKFDKDESGAITAEELGEVLAPLGYDNLTESDLKRVVNKFDTNGDGSIDFNEFVTMMCQAERKDEDEIQSAFRVFDRDGDGTITWREIMKVMQMLGEDVDEEACKLMIKSVDLDGNGTVDVDEFRKMMRDGFAMT